jgi:protein SCO1
MTEGPDVSRPQIRTGTRPDATPPAFSRGKLAVVILLVGGMVGAGVNVFTHWVGWDEARETNRPRRGFGEAEAPIEDDETAPRPREPEDLPDDPDSPGPLPTLHVVTDFELIDSDGKPFGRKDLLGKVWVADFIYTYCSGPCPKMSAAMADLHREPAFRDVRFVSISIDPSRDTPESLREYAANYQADVARWKFLTGDRAAIARLAKEGFLQADDAGDPLLHSVQFLLVDREGRLRGTYLGTSPNMQKRLRRHLNRLLAEEGGGAGK